ncbi:ABC transporter ATP-binding protein [Mesorhizobium retamae]|uniref:ABC transporter ATP-binding protein n=1 Tax=Mesorhizobium retamae TaxID=2912854 RepID=A0ABS9QM36_9HYPH|nr:ABC transporter ATP-binding protein [Mesorhizobium sp. IRAMC:0171]MCG7508508.1 ABC transporter ATP-binding protein [Mesorhizobium sp. IRAMC:0171]
MTGIPLIEARDLIKTYGSRRRLIGESHPVYAVNGVSLKLARGETLGLVGESGCGKSTLGRLILGLEIADSGSVEFDGSPLARAGSAEWRRSRARMQMVFQDPLSALDRLLPIAAQIREPLIIHKFGSQAQMNKRVGDLLNAVGLTAAQGRRLPGELSGGQRQRAVLARALATSPDLLVCDEPTSALDMLIQAQVLDLFAEIQSASGVAILFISHDLRALRRVSDRVAVMYLGSIVEEGPAKQVLEAPRHPYTQALISSVPGVGGLSPNRILLRGEPPSPTQRRPGCAFQPRCAGAVHACNHTAPTLLPVSNPSHRVACHLLHPGGEPASIARPVA